MRVLVTGAAGFLGSHLVTRLLREGYEVLGIDSLITGDINNLQGLENNDRFNFVIRDVRDPIDVDVKLIFNLACPASPAAYQEHPMLTLTSSIGGAENMARLAYRKGAVLVHASTSEVYGDPLVHPQKEDYWGNVNPIGKRACYDEGKRAAETLLSVSSADARIVRIFNTYGPNMKINDGRVVSNFITQALKNEPVTIYGSGKQTRSLCYVDDLIDGLMKIGNARKFAGPINLGSPQEISMKTLANKVIELSDSSSEIVYTPLPMDDPKRRKPDISKAIKTIGFRARVPLEKGLQNTIAYFRNQLLKGNG